MSNKKITGWAFIQVRIIWLLIITRWPEGMVPLYLQNNEVSHYNYSCQCHWFIPNSKECIISQGRGKLMEVLKRTLLRFLIYEFLVFQRRFFRSAANLLLKEYHNPVLWVWLDFLFHPEQVSILQQHITSWQFLFSVLYPKRCCNRSRCGPFEHEHPARYQKCFFNT